MGHTVVVIFLRLHLQDEISSLHRDILWVEDTRVGIKGATGLVPTLGIELVEIVAPVQMEFIVILIPGEDLNVVVEDEPWHVSWVEALAPRVEGGRPEVHPKRLLLVHILEGGIVFPLENTNLLVIDGPADVSWRPLHRVCVPIIAWVEIMCVGVRLTLVVSIAPDSVHREWIMLDRRHNFNVQLVPVSGSEVRAVPVSEEGGHCAHLVRRLHASDELAVCELLVAGDGTAAVGIRLCYSNDCNDSSRKLANCHIFDRRTTKALDRQVLFL